MKRTVAAVLVALMTILCIGGGYSESDALNDGIEAQQIILDQLPEQEQESEDNMAAGDKLVNLDDLKVSHDKNQEDINGVKIEMSVPCILPPTNASAMNQSTGATIVSDGKTVTINKTAGSQFVVCINSASLNNATSISGATAENTKSKINPNRYYHLHYKLIDGSLTKNGTTYTSENFNTNTQNSLDVANIYLFDKTQSSAAANNLLSNRKGELVNIIEDSVTGSLIMFLYSDVSANNAKFEVWVEEIDKIHVGSDVLQPVSYLAATSDGSIKFAGADYHYPLYVSQKIPVPQTVVDGMIRTNATGNNSYCAVVFYDENNDIIGTGTRSASDSNLVEIPSGTKYLVLSDFTGTSSADPSSMYVDFYISKTETLNYIARLVETKNSFGLEWLWDENILMEHTGIEKASGNVIVSDNGNYTSTKLIKIPENSKGIIGAVAYSASTNAILSFYNSEKVFISGEHQNVNNNRVRNFTIPDGAKYVRCSTHSTIPPANAKFYLLTDGREIEKEKKNTRESVLGHPGILCFNHQGASQIAPSNTIPAFILSKAKDFLGIETDVRATSDGVFVLCHDYTINATARNSDGTEISGDVPVNSKTYAELLEYDFGIYRGERYKGTKIPTLAQFLDLCRKLNVYPMIEIQTVDVNTSAQIESIVKMVNDYGMKGRVIYACFNIQPLMLVTDYDELADVGLNIDQEMTVETIPFSDANKLKTGVNKVALLCRQTRITDDIAKAIVKNDYRLGAWVVDSASAEAALSDAVTIFTSNYYNVAKKLTTSEIRPLVNKCQSPDDYLMLNYADLYFNIYDNGRYTEIDRNRIEQRVIDDTESNYGLFSLVGAEAVQTGAQSDAKIVNIFNDGGYIPNVSIASGAKFKYSIVSSIADDSDKQTFGFCFASYNPTSETLVTDFYNPIISEAFGYHERELSSNLINAANENKNLIILFYRKEGGSTGDSVNICWSISGLGE